MIQDTSLAAWDAIQSKLGAKQKQVLDVLRLLPNATNAELAAKLGWPINTITPRVNELRKMELVLDVGKRRCQVTGSKAHTWRAKYNAIPEAFEHRRALTDNQPQLL